MLELQSEGKVGALGVSNFDVELLDRCEALGHVDSLQPPFSLINRAAAADVIPWCRRNGTGVIVYSPMQSGLLSGRFTRERAANLPKIDWRTHIDAFSEPHLTRNLALQEALRPIAQRHDVSVAAVAVAWPLAWSGVTGAIVGARSPAQLDDWIGGGSLKLTRTDISDVEAALTATGAGAGPISRASSGQAQERRS
jgi:aryl-alcohol dehydrogenase-like predicted oxidoreductase